MLEFLTVDEMKTCDHTEADIQAVIDEKKATLGEKQEHHGRHCRLHATFNELKGFYGDQAKRLGNIAVVMNKYKTTDCEHYGIDNSN
ncbi:hypothetical protein TrLO_g6923 [Triparma laevis f. longispina]|uniref:Uncharacterized protein n=1 Tax=Triparma laevis f. longispina TaxID=1714387 RepID=A0A9W7C6F2_9STRA|nr:hypothetical protein TrLO_g6923 [Triparma laevis f. longispina]